MALPGNGTILAVDPRRIELARQAARQIVALVEMNLHPRDIVTADAINNAFALDMAMGGSTNTVLHSLALAHEVGVDYPIARLNNVADQVPTICKVSPSSESVFNKSRLIVFDSHYESTKTNWGAFLPFLNYGATYPNSEKWAQYG